MIQPWSLNEKEWKGLGDFSGGESGEEELYGTDPTQDYYQEKKISSLGKRLYCTLKKSVRKT